MTRDGCVIKSLLDNLKYDSNSISGNIIFYQRESSSEVRSFLFFGGNFIKRDFLFSIASAWLDSKGVVQLHSHCIQYFLFTMKFVVCCSFH